MPKTLRRLLLPGLLALAFAVAPCPAEEVSYPGDDFAKLDTFESTESSLSVENRNLPVYRFLLNK